MVVLPSVLFPFGQIMDGEPKKVRPKYEVVFGAWAVQIVGVSLVYTWGLFLPAFDREWPGSSKATLGMTGSFFMASFMGGGII